MNEKHGYQPEGQTPQNLEPPKTKEALLLTRGGKVIGGVLEDGALLKAKEEEKSKELKEIPKDEPMGSHNTVMVALERLGAKIDLLGEKVDQLLGKTENEMARRVLGR